MQILKNIWQLVPIFYNVFVIIHLSFRAKEPSRQFDPTLEIYLTYNLEQKITSSLSFRSPLGLVYKYLLNKTNSKQSTQQCKHRPLQSVKVTL